MMAMGHNPIEQESGLAVKQRLFLAVVALLGCGATLYNWRILGFEHRYYPKVAFFAPCFAVLFGAVSVVPSLAGPMSLADKHKKYRQAALLLLGLAAGLINWYAMVRS
jgi:hypothetical protein